MMTVKTTTTGDTSGDVVLTTQTTEQPGEGDATAADAGPSGQPAPATFTQEQLDAIVKDRLARATTKTQADLLSELGAEDVETAKTTLAEAQAAREAQMSELEKAQAQIAELQAQSEQAKAEAEAIKAKADEALLKAAIVSQAGQFNDPLDAWSFIDRSKVEVSEDGTYKGIDEALKTLTEAKPYLLKPDSGAGPGTPQRKQSKSMVEKLFEKTQTGGNEPQQARRPTVKF